MVKNILSYHFPIGDNDGSGGDQITAQAPEVDLGLMAVGTEKVGAIKLRNTGDIPVSFAVLEAGDIFIACLLPVGHTDAQIGKI